MAEIEQNKTITGRIIDEMGSPIIGANIIEVSDISNGTVTDIDGFFTLNVEDEATIQVTYIGFLPQNINTAGRTNFEIILIEDTQSLDELIVVGYGVQKKKLITGANVSVGSETIQSQNALNALEAIQSFAPGVNITQASGMPGEGFQVNIWW